MTNISSYEAIDFLMFLSSIEKKISS